MTLEEITALENEWLAKHPYGRVKDLHTACEQMGIYDAWRNTFKQYVILARQDNLEALKRALFLHWYACSEPNELSGIFMLNKSLVMEVLTLVNNLILEEKLDTELKWMLSYYYSDTDWYIDRFEGFDELKKISRDTDSKMFWEFCPDSSFDNRGQLGNYWKSIQENLTRDWGDMGAYL